VPRLGVAVVAILIPMLLHMMGGWRQFRFRDYPFFTCPSPVVVRFPVDEFVVLVHHGVGNGPVAAVPALLLASPSVLAVGAPVRFDPEGLLGKSGAAETETGLVAETAL